MGRIRGRGSRNKARSRLKKRKRLGWKPKPSRKAIKKHNSKRKRSSLEITLAEWLVDAGIQFKKEYPIGRCHVDFLIGDRTCVEAQGCFWHGCMICNRNLTNKQKVAQIKDARRFAFFRNKGYDVITIWECEVNLEPERIKAMLRALKC